MIDIYFYMKVHDWKKQVTTGGVQRKGALKFLESCRSAYPVVFNIETTNACNMTCPFCPRTTLMTRPVKTMGEGIFEHVADQLYPHPRELWNEWIRFAKHNYGVSVWEQSENAFFLYILPRVIVLHGYGDPLLDPHIPDYVGMLTRRDVPSYFSCNPANIRLDRTERAFENGLNYIKYAIDSLSDPARGKDAFQHDYPLIMDVLNMKAQKGYDTQVIITMIDLGHPNQEEEFAALKEAFKGTDVYIYMKSADQSNLTGSDKPKSIHWSEFCQIPWSSMSISSMGLSVSCQENFDSDIVLGDVMKESLFDIWNGDKYKELRRQHIEGPVNTICYDYCEMTKLSELLEKG